MKKHQLWNLLNDDWRKLLSINYFFNTEFISEHRETTLNFGVNPFDLYKYRFGKEYIESLTEQEFVQKMEHISVLYLASSDITELDCVKLFTNLEILDFSFNHVVDISPLADMPRLKKIIADSNSISDITSIEKTISLEELILRHNQINNLAAIGQLNNIRFLDIGQNRVDTLDKLSSLAKLEEISIDSNFVTDIFTLGSLTNLRMINMSVNNISNVDRLLELPLLEFVDMTGTLITPSESIVTQLRNKKIEVII